MDSAPASVTLCESATFDQTSSHWSSMRRLRGREGRTDRGVKPQRTTNAVRCCCQHPPWTASSDSRSDVRRQARRATLCSLKILAGQGFHCLNPKPHACIPLQLSWPAGRPSRCVQHFRPKAGLLLNVGHDTRTTRCAIMQPCGCMRSPDLIGPMFLGLSDTTVSPLLLRSTFVPEPTRMNATVGDSPRCECQHGFSVGPWVGGHSAGLKGKAISDCISRTQISQPAHPPQPHWRR